MKTHPVTPLPVTGAATEVSVKRRGNILPLPRLQKNLKVHFKLRGTQDMVKTFSFASPFQPGLLRCLIYSVLEGEHKSKKNGIVTVVTIGGDATKSGKNTHLLVVMRVRILQKMGLLDLKNRTQFKTENCYKISTKSVRNYRGSRLMLHTRSIYYWHKNVDLLVVCLVDYT